MPTIDVSSPGYGLTALIPNDVTKDIVNAAALQDIFTYINTHPGDFPGGVGTVYFPNNTWYQQKYTYGSGFYSVMAYPGITIQGESSTGAIIKVPPARLVAGGDIEGITRSTPGNACRVTMTGHGLVTNDQIYFEGITQSGGWTKLNWDDTQSWFPANTQRAFYVVYVDVDHFDLWYFVKFDTSYPLDTSSFTQDYNPGSDPGVVRRVYSRVNQPLGLITCWWDNASDSATLALKDIQLNGNLPNRGPWSMYEQESCELLGLYTSDTESGGALVVTLDNVRVYDGVSDGVHCRNFIKLTGTDLYVKDCFRGGVLAATRYSNVLGMDISLTNFYDVGSVWPSGFYQEDCYGARIYGRNWDLPLGHVCIYNVSGTSTIDLDGFTFGGMANATAGWPNSFGFFDMTGTIKNGSIDWKTHDAESSIKGANCDIAFDNVTFELRDYGDAEYANDWVFIWLSGIDGLITFDGCSFGCNAEVTTGIKAGFAFQANDSVLADNNRLVLNNCIFKSSLDWAIYSTGAYKNQGLHIDINMPILQCANFYNLEVDNQTYANQVDVNWGYTRGNYVSLPVTDADLTTAYSGADMTAVATDDNTTYVSQSASGQYAIHEFKNDATGKSSCTVTWNGQSNLDNTLSRPTILEIYNTDTSAWVELNRDTSTLANNDFTLSFPIVGNLDDYKDTNGLITCRVYQSGS